MADSKITALTALTAADPANDMIPIVDVSDTPPASGNTKRISINNILACSPSATLASATITGDLTVRTTGLVVNSTGASISNSTPLSGVDSGLLVGAVGSSKSVVVSMANCLARLRERDAVNNFAITTNIGPTGTIDDNTRSSWKIRIGSGNENFALERAPAGSATFYGLLAIDSGGVCAWGDGAGGTRMTLNSTGLGVGVSPAFKIHANGVIGTTNTFGAFTALQTTGGTGYRWTLSNDNNFYLQYSPDGFGSTATSRIALDSTGNVGIGVTPSAWDSGFQVIENSGGSLWSGSTGAVRLSQNAYYATSLKYKNALAASQYVQTSGQHQWFNAPSGTAGNAITFTQAMTLDASGNLLVGLTVDSFAPSKGIAANASSSSRISVGHASGTSSGDYYHSFAYNSTVIGSITQNGTTGVLYNINSDYRLKESVAPLSGGLARVSALKPSMYKWKSDGSSGEGFLAHELAEVVPAAVTGEKDAVNEDGSIKSQGIDMSRIVPILVAAIQELTAEVNALKKA